MVSLLITLAQFWSAVRMAWRDPSFRTLAALTGLLFLVGTLVFHELEQEGCERRPRRRSRPPSGLPLASGERGIRWAGYRSADAPCRRESSRGLPFTNNTGLERSPAGADGWYIHGACDRNGAFVVQALAPRRLLRLHPERVITSRGEPPADELSFDIEYLAALVGRAHAGGDLSAPRRGSLGARHLPVRRRKPAHRPGDAKCLEGR